MALDPIFVPPGIHRDGSATMIRRIFSRHQDPDTDVPAPKPGALVRRGELAEIRRHTPRDREDFARWYMDPDIAELLRHDLRPLTPNQARGYFESIVLPASANGTAWAIHDRVSGNLIGTTAVTQIDRKAGSCLFRIVIGEKQAWGHGFGSDATRLIAHEVFETLDLQTLNLEVFAHNPRAEHVYRKIGFEETGRTVEWVGTRRLDVIAMTLTKDHWRHLHATQP